MAYGQLVHAANQRLREWLESYKPGANGRLPSERALARELGLRHYAVNRAMSHLIAEGAVERRGQKLYCGFPRKSHESRKFRCDLVINRHSVHLDGYRRVARDLSLDLRIHTWQSVEESIAILRRFRVPECESVVFDPPFRSPVSRWEPVTSRLVRQGIPVVCINRHGSEISTVIGDRVQRLKLLFDYFLELGHEHLAFLVVRHGAPAASETLIQWRDLCVKNGLADSAGRIFLQNDARFLREDAKRLAARFTKDWNMVTALAVYMDNEYQVQQLIDALRARKIDVPDQLSLAFLEDGRPLQTSSPPVTASTTDNVLLQEAAYLLACHSIRKKREFGILPPPSTLIIQPRLIRRASCAPNAGPPRRSARPVKNVPAEEPRPSEFPDDPAELAAIRHRPYDLALKVAETRFSQIDLSSHVNRPLNFRRGWLGDLPLKNFPPGRHKLHGIPFDVLGGNKRADCGAVVFQSQTNSTGNARKLPSSLKIAINRKATAIYFLHGCGYARHLHPFATYTFQSGRCKLGEVPLVALGRPQPDLSREALEKTIGRANIQDWWPDYPHCEFSHAKVVPLLEDEHSEDLHRHVFLYTLEWINPSPQKTVTHLTIQSDTGQSTTLGLLGICVLGPSMR